MESIFCLLNLSFAQVSNKLKDIFEEILTVVRELLPIVVLYGRTRRGGLRGGGLPCGGCQRFESLTIIQTPPRSNFPLF
jgi:hypothetical protein